MEKMEGGDIVDHAHTEHSAVVRPHSDAHSAGSTAFNSCSNLDARRRKAVHVSHVTVSSTKPSSAAICVHPASSYIRPDSTCRSPAPSPSAPAPLLARVSHTRPLVSFPSPPCVWLSSHRVASFVPFPLTMSTEQVRSQQLTTSAWPPTRSPSQLDRKPSAPRRRCAETRHLVSPCSVCINRAPLICRSCVAPRVVGNSCSTPIDRSPNSSAECSPRSNKSLRADPCPTRAYEP